jgi:DNA replication and repair protein RecF
MSLAELSAQNVRCIETVQLELHPQRNLIWGLNGSGKTSVLEAIFLLGRGRSFRTRRSERLIRHGAQRLVSFGRTAGAIETTVGVQVVKGEPTVAKVGGSAVQSLAELSTVFPVQVIDPGVHKLVEEGSYRRRRWMDWAVFHVEHGFADHWARYTRALRQRNAALRQQPEQASVWDPELARLGETIADLRRRSLEQLQPIWREVSRLLLGPEVELVYHQGWNRELALADALRESRDRDRARGATQPGAHRADVAVRLAGVPARDSLSRGQQKLVAVAMILAQLRMLRAVSGLRPTLLLDDPAAELDAPHLEALIGQVAELHCQLVMTSLDPQMRLFGVPDRVFHVERGTARQV